jgi:hypothetical protein
LRQSVGKRITFNGEFVQLGNFQDVLYVGADEPWISLEVNVKLSEKVSKAMIPLLRHPLISEKFSKLDELGYKISFNESEFSQSFLVNRKRIFTASFLEVERGLHTGRIEFPQPLEQATCVDPTLILSPEGLAFAPSGRENILRHDIESFSKILNMICGIIRKEITHTYYVSALRELAIEVAGDSYFPEWVGRNGKHTVGLLALIFGSREYEQTKTKICKWASVFGLEELRAGWRGRTELSADFRDPKTHAILKVTAAGYGSVQMLPIITQLFWSPRHSTISFEEPEISLHLELISKLPIMFSEVIKEGKQLIVTTHEQNIFFALKPLIAKKEVSYGNVAIYELKKSSEGSTVQKLKLTPEGVIKGGISSFVEAERNMVYQWMYTIRPAEGEKESDA